MAPNLGDDYVVFGQSTIDFKGKDGADTISKVKLTASNNGEAVFASATASQLVRVRGVETPVLNTDAATKGYVDGKAAGLTLKGTVLYATTGSLYGDYTHSNGDYFIKAHLATNDWDTITPSEIDYAAADTTTFDTYGKAKVASAWSTDHTLMKASKFEFCNANHTGDDTSEPANWPTRILVNHQGGQRTVTDSQGATSTVNWGDARENGIYYLYSDGEDEKAPNGTTVNTGTGRWILKRTSNFDNSPVGEIMAGAFVFVQDGVLYKNRGYTLVQPVNLGTEINIELSKVSSGAGQDGHPLSFQQFSGAGQLSVGPNLVQSGDTISTKPVVNLETINLSTAGTSLTATGAATIEGKVTLTNDPQGAGEHGLDCVSLKATKLVTAAQLAVDSGGVVSTGSVRVTSADGIRTDKIVLNQDPAGSADGLLEFGDITCGKTDGVATLEKLTVAKASQVADVTSSGSVTLTNAASQLTAQGTMVVHGATSLNSSLQVTGTSTLSTVDCGDTLAQSLKTKSDGTSGGNIEAGAHTTGGVTSYYGDVKGKSLVASTAVQAPSITSTSSSTLASATADTVHVTGTHTDAGKSGYSVFATGGLRGNKVKSTGLVETQTLTVSTTAEVTGLSTLTGGLTTNGGTATVGPLTAASLTTAGGITSDTSLTGTGDFAWNNPAGGGASSFTVTPQITATAGLTTPATVNANAITAATVTATGDVTANNKVVGTQGLETTQAVKGSKLDFTLASSATGTHHLIHGDTDLTKGTLKLDITGAAAGTTDALDVVTGSVKLQNGSINLDGASSSISCAGSHLLMNKTGSKIVAGASGTVSAPTIRAGTAGGADGTDFSAGAATGTVQCGTIECAGSNGISADAMALYKVAGAPVTIDQLDVNIGQSTGVKAGLGTETLRCPNVITKNKLTVEGSGGAAIEVTAGSTVLKETSATTISASENVTFAKQILQTGDIVFDTVAATRGKIKNVNDIESNGIVYANSFYALSDERVKERIMSIDRADALKKLTELRAMSYNMKGSDAQDVGFLAQQVKTVIPEVVHVSNGPVGEDTHRIDYSKMVPVVVAGFQKLVEKVEEQSRQLTALRAQVAAC